MTYLKDVIRNLLKRKENKLNFKKTDKDDFYDKFENKINFLSDAYLLPELKNHFTCSINKKTYKNCVRNETIEFENIHNVIDKTTLIYLNTLKLKYQKQKDERETISDNRSPKGPTSPQKKREENEDKKYDYNYFFLIEDFLDYKYRRYEKTGFTTEEKIINIIQNNFDELPLRYQYEMENLFPEPKLIIKSVK